ncbi:hypothetical protein AVEN_149799-1 [Araneus ventricosus]|uniref:Spidroin N-terminal domain-containing protein n=1 Tax=Araneus ventricosus TaxID=182803 RepID=A0A4Y2JSI9_ARAVE|nr:hypothetical protein AVEN_149799-1 [Araneus ventricosus]
MSTADTSLSHIKGRLYSRLPLSPNLRMSFPLRIAFAFIFAFLQLVAGAENCIWCNKKTENDFLDCVSKKITRNRELNIPPDVVEAMVTSLKAASSVINTSDNIKSEIMKGAFAGEVLGMVVSIQSPGRNTNSVVASVMGSIEECYIAVTGQSGTKFSSSINRAVTNMMLGEDSDSNGNEYSLSPETGFGSTCN